MKNQNYTQLYGGLLARSISEDAVASLESAQAPKARKTKRKKSSGENDTRGNGKRGRPRVDPNDQSAVERRRTQIRLAQRAYRERKETTISALEQRVSELMDTVNEMNQVFLDYNTKAISSGIALSYPSLGLELKETMNRFLQLARNVNVDFNIDEPEDSPRETSRGSTQDNDAAGFDQPIFVSSVSQLELLHQHSPPEMTATLGYEVSYEGVTIDIGTNNDAQQLMTDQNYSMSHGLQDPNWQQFNLQRYSMEKMPQYSKPTTDPISNMLPSIPNSPESPYTYSFQETTFARRLLRYSYEKAYRIITDPSSSQESIHCRLRFSFCYTDLASIIFRIREILTRTRHQNLENWDVPILHNGGAGLHFPRGGLDSETDPAPVNWKDGRLNTRPRRLGDAQTKEADQLEVGEFAKFAHCEGIWLDPNDVEQYLRTKGLYLDGQSSLAEIEVDVPPPLASGTAAGSPHSSSTESFDSPASSEDLALNMNLFSARENGGSFYDLNTSSSSWPGMELPDPNPSNGNIDFTFEWSNSINNRSAKSQANPAYLSRHVVNTNANMNLFPTYHPPPHFHPPRKRKLTIDVDKLLERLNGHSICMGRAPGYRKEKVDVAFREAIREAVAF